MTTWVNNLADLGAVGIQVSEDQERLLTEGGLAIVPMGVPAPICYYECDSRHYLHDIYGNQAMVIGRIWCHPLEVSMGGYYGKATAAEYAEVEVGQGWRYWPSVVADLESPLEDVGYHFNQSPLCWRLWDVLPVSEAVCDLIFSTANQYVAASDIPPTLSFIQDQMEGPFSYGNMFHSGFAEEAEEGDEVLRGPDAQHLIKVGVLDEAGGFLKEPDFVPLDEILHEPEALATWKRLVRRSRSAHTRALASIPMAERAAYLHMEESFSPWS